MMEVSTSIDYLRYSGPIPQRLTDVLPELLEPDRDKKIKALPYYTDAVELIPAGRLDWNRLKPSQGSLVTLAGDALRAIEAYGIDKTYLSEYASQNANLSVTRIDLAVDVVGVSEAPTDVIKAWEAGEIKTRARGCKQIHGWCKEKKRDGNTVYVGSRDGENYLRVYDKGSQKKLDDLLWSRVELELKGGKAGIAARAISGVGLKETTAAALNRFITMPTVSWWGEMIAKLPDIGTACMAGENHNKAGSAWLHSQALPAVIRAIKANDFTCIDQVIQALSEWDQWEV